MVLAFHRGGGRRGRVEVALFFPPQGVVCVCWGGVRSCVRPCVCVCVHARARVCTPKCICLRTCGLKAPTNKLCVCVHTCVRTTKCEELGYTVT